MTSPEHHLAMKVTGLYCVQIGGNDNDHILSMHISNLFHNNADRVRNIMSVIFPAKQLAIMDTSLHRCAHIR